MVRDRVKISATLITLNEEENLPRALSSLSFCDEILVVDSGSTDRTLEIAEQGGARVIQNPWPGFSAQKNFAAEQATHDWALALDADEAVTDELQEQILALAAGSPAHAGYAFPRKARYLGRWILHSGWYPDRKVRLYDRRRARWVGDYVHESVAVDGSVGQLDGDLLHYTCDSFSEHIRTLDRYTTLAAREHAALRLGVGWHHLTLSPIWAFIRSYLLKLGFLDGFHGLLIAQAAAFYVFAKYAKVRAGQQSG